MTLLAIDWAVVGIKAGQLILSLSILVVLHEMGHFLPAKWFKCRVEKFYLFFDPWFSLFKKKIGETVYGVGWLPLGGYVKISGMVDESMDKEQMKQPPQPWEFRSKPAWQRLIIMIGGVTVNLLLGFALFAMILFVWGEEYLPASNVKYGIYVDSTGRKMGLQDGDKIVSLDGKEVDNFNKINLDIILSEAKSMQVERNGQLISLPIPQGTIRGIIAKKGVSFAIPRYPAVVDSVTSSAKFVSGKFQKGDTIIQLNDIPITSFAQLQDRKRSFADTTVALRVIRGSDTVNISVRTDEGGNFGFFALSIDKHLTFSKKSYTLLEAIPAGVKKAWNTLGDYSTNMKMIFTSKEVKASESLGSFISIGSMFGSEWNWQQFWGLTALLSLILAFMNILPIPALDGGHVVFTLYEMITGRKPSDKFMEYAQMVGMALLLGLMAYALGLDFWRLFK